MCYHFILLFRSVVFVLFNQVHIIYDLNKIEAICPCRAN